MGKKKHKKEKFVLASEPKTPEITPKKEEVELELRGGFVSGAPQIGSQREVDKAAQRIFEAAPWLGNQLAGLTNYRNTYSVRDLTYSQWKKVLDKAEWTAKFNPLASRALEIRTNLIISEGLYPKATCEKEKDKKELQEFMDEHWEINDWHTKIGPRVKDLGITGEMWRMIPEYATNPENKHYKSIKHVELYSILPHEIIKVGRDEFDSEKLDFATHLDSRVGTDYNYVGRDYPVVRREKFGLEKGALVGNLLNCNINCVTGATRGLSDLLPVVEWLDVLDQLLWNDAERSAQMLKFMFDVTLTGATQDSIARREMDLKSGRSPNRGSIIIHPENEVWKVIQPQLASAESDVVVNRLFLHCWGGLGLPEHWYAQANTVNKSSGDEMSIPVWSWARSRKILVCEFLRRELMYAIQIAKRNGFLRKDLEVCFEIQSRDPDRTAYDQLGASLASLASALKDSVGGQSYLSREAANQMFTHVANAWGLDIPPELASKIEENPDIAMQVAADNNPKLKELKKEKAVPENGKKQEKSNGS